MISAVPHISTDYSSTTRTDNMKVTYDTNNSGGVWWLGKGEWEALRNAGWELSTAEPYLGAYCHSATLECDSLEAAVESWEEATGMEASDQGCPCCGPPHSFHDAGYNYHQH